MAKSKTVPLSRVVKTKQERWNARWFAVTGEIKINDSKLSADHATKLRTLLDQYGESWAIPDRLVDDELAFARQSGFPYDYVDGDERLDDWKTLVASKTEKKDGMYQWVGREGRLATSFHPHFYECREKGKMSPLEFFQSDVDLRRGIAKILCLYGKMTSSKLRVMCRDEDASSMITNFAPRVSKAILQELFKEPINLLDPCSGFSGRLLGACASGLVSKYVGIDLSPYTHAGLVKTADFIKSVGNQTQIELFHDDCIRKMAEMTEQYDCILTSPPFLDKEEYKGVKFETDYKKWAIEFIEPFIELCFRRLRTGGKLVIYSENIAKNKALSDDLSRFTSKIGFNEESPINFKKTPGAYHRSGGAFKVTAIKVWTK